MWCPGCGREQSGNAKYCQYCGHAFFEAPVEASPIVYKSPKMPSALWLVIIGFVVIGLGGVLYVVGMDNALDSTPEWYSDPTTDSSSFLEAFDIVFAAYFVMMVGTVLLFLGLILLVIHE